MSDSRSAEPSLEEWRANMLAIIRGQMNNHSHDYARGWLARDAAQVSAAPPKGGMSPTGELTDYQRGYVDGQEAASAAPPDEGVAFPAKPGDEPPDDYARTWYEAGKASAAPPDEGLRKALQEIVDLFNNDNIRPGDYIFGSVAIARRALAADTDKPRDG